MGSGAAEAFDLLNNVSTEFYALAYVIMFAIAFLGAHHLRARLPWWVVAFSVVGAVTNIVVLVLNAYPFVDVASPARFAVKIVGALTIANAIGYAFYRSRRLYTQTASIE